MLQIKHLSLFFVLAFATLMTAQDTTLPQGKCSIYLLSGKTIDDARMWKIQPAYLEYLKNESLHDVPLQNISYIRTTAGDFEFDSTRLVRIEYDQIILLSGNIIFCFVKEINPVSIIYTRPGKTCNERIERYNVRKLHLAGVEEEKINTIIAPTSAPIKKDSAIGPRRTGSAYTDTTIDYYALGKADGKREFKGNGSLTGGLLLGFVPVFGWLATPITLAIPPNTNPSNFQLYTANKQYHAGYESGAWKKKALRTLTGALAGALVFFALTAH